MAKQHSKKEFEDLGRALVSMFETGYPERKQFYKMSFIKGVVTGFGTVVGATIVVGLVLWILGLFDNVPFIDRAVDTLKSSK